LTRNATKKERVLGDPERKRVAVEFQVCTKQEKKKAGRETNEEVSRTPVRYPAKLRMLKKEDQEPASWKELVDIPSHRRDFGKKTGAERGMG